MAKLKVGDAFEADVKVGPLIEDKALDKVEEHLTKVQAAGGKVLTGGSRHALGGRFFQPTVTLGGDDALFREEETFGPLVPVFAFDDEAEVLDKANASALRPGLLRLHPRSGPRHARGARAGERHRRRSTPAMVSTPVAPFGGVKQSGYGREGSVHGIEEYLDIKAVTLNLR